MVKKEDILSATDCGKSVILYYYPQSAAGFSSKRNFRLRSDDRNPSAAVFLRDGMWFLQDKGGSDNKAYNAISMVMEREGLTFPLALEWIASKFAPHLLDDKSGKAIRPQPTIRKTTPVDRITVNCRKNDTFTDKELSLLGYKISGDICRRFSLHPVDSYITKRNEKGDSYEITATEDYPIYYYDYGKWGKIYQPLGELRFMYAGDKPESFLFGEDKVLSMYADALKGKIPGASPESEEGEDDGYVEDERLDRLVICSGPSDALNVYAAGYHVCWPNSETEGFSSYQMSLLAKIAKEIYVLFDIDDTGIKNAYKLAMQYLDVKLIILPEDLKKFTTKGKPCKDVKDFMMFYRKPNKPNPWKAFDDIVKTSLSMKFWLKTEKGGYDINNLSLYNFLSASGFSKIDMPSDKKGFAYCHVKDRVVEVIRDEQFAARCNSYLIDYLREHTEYYSLPLLLHITRSKQMSLSSLDKLQTVTPDFISHTKKTDHVFFRNCIARVTDKGIDTVQPDKCPFYVYSDKIIKRDFRVLPPLFEVSWSAKGKALSDKLDSLAPLTPEYSQVKRQLDRMLDSEKYTLVIHNKDFSFLKFVYNTGRTYWRQEEDGYPLTEEAQGVHQLNFINKVAALGYMMSRYKDASKPYAIYGMETEQAEEGEHKGGTGKSLFMSAIQFMRKQVQVDGQMLDPNDFKFIFEEVQKGVTDNIAIDDLNRRVPLAKFMSMITGRMTINKKNVAAYSIPYTESPKISFTSNHAISKFDPSMRRRTWFVAFSDYYHSEDPQAKLSEWNPGTEFGKQLIYDYTDEEMNLFYNFMLQCLHTYLKFGRRIQPPMKQIEERILRRELTDEFIWWADDYFTRDRLDCEMDKHETFADYKRTLTKIIADSIKVGTFIRKIDGYCRLKGYTLNPPFVLNNESDRQRKEIHRSVNGEDKYYFYICTQKLTEDGQESEDMPDFAI